MIVDLRKIILGDGLTSTERLYLESLRHHDGWPVLERIMREAVRRAVEDVVGIDPEDKDYESSMRARQLRARYMSEFHGAVIKSMEANITIGNNAEKKANERNNSTTDA